MSLPRPDHIVKRAYFYADINQKQLNETSLAVWGLVEKERWML
jgi:hypothetical protein